MSENSTNDSQNPEQDTTKTGRAKIKIEPTNVSPERNKEFLNRQKRIEGLESSGYSPNAQYDAPKPPQEGSDNTTQKPHWDKPRYNNDGGGDRPRYNKEGGDRPRYNKEGGNDRPRYNNDGGDRPRYNSGGDRPRYNNDDGGDRPRYNKEGGDRPRYNKEGGDRPRYNNEGGNDRPRYNKEGGNDRPRYNNDGGDRPRYNSGGDRPRYNNDDGGDRPRYNSGGDRPRYNKEGGNDRPRYNNEGGNARPRYNKEGGNDRPRYNNDGGDRPRYNKEGGDRPRYNKEGGDRPRYNNEGGDRPRYNKEGGNDRPRYNNDGGDRPKRSWNNNGEGGYNRKPYNPGGYDKKPYSKYRDPEQLPPMPPDEIIEHEADNTGKMPLNKFIAHSGVCSRRDAADLVAKGEVMVNGIVETNPGYKVLPEDVITYQNKTLTPQKGLIYVLLNKPKDYITTTDDPNGRKTVMELLQGISTERMYPVGRLDRNTTGLLLITNDGDLANKLAHPSYNIKKIYHVTLDKDLSEDDYNKIKAGIMLEDGLAEVDAVYQLENKNEVGLEIHSGKNRIVRRIFEALRYGVEKLDRVMYAGLTKKNIPRGRWRTLTAQEVIHLKHFNS